MTSRRALAVGVACLVLSGCGSSAGTVGTSLGGSTATAQSTAASAISVIDVTCLARTTEVVGESATVSSAGLQVRVVDRSGRSGAYLNFGYPRSDGGHPGGGFAVPSGASLLILAVPPGPVDLNCSYDTGRTQTPKVRITAADPNHYYRAATLADLGCAGGLNDSWAIRPAHGASPEAAVAALIKLTDPTLKLTATRAAIGYLDAPPTYLLHRGERPWASVVVMPDQGGGFSAMPDYLC